MINDKRKHKLYFTKIKTIYVLKDMIKTENNKKTKEKPRECEKHLQIKYLI